MKKALVMILVLALMLTVVACKQKKKNPQEDPTGTQATQLSAATTEDLTGEVTVYEGPSNRDLALDCINQDVQILFDTIGYPIKMEYFESAMNEGDEVEIEEGVLTYDGFVVYTLREGASEIVYDVV